MNGVGVKGTIRHTSNKGFRVIKLGRADLILRKGICARDAISTEASDRIEDRRVVKTKNEINLPLSTNCVNGLTNCLYPASNPNICKKMKILIMAFNAIVVTYGVAPS